MSKTAVNIAGVSLAHDLADRGVAVLMVYPGSVRTDLTASVMSAGQDIDVEESASGIIARIDELTFETTGWFRHAKGEHCFGRADRCLQISPLPTNNYCTAGQLLDRISLSIAI